MGVVITPILQKVSEAKSFAQGHMAGHWQVGQLPPELMFLTTAPLRWGQPQYVGLPPDVGFVFQVDTGNPSLPPFKIPGSCCCTCKTNLGNFLLGETCTECPRNITKALVPEGSLVWGSEAQEHS